jgi:hypothetical protein|tara:strand:- start:44 stop:805 length:762 start_codon:yes stop_codon:yes gene_type:complete
MTLPILTLKANDSGLKIGDHVPTIDANVQESCILADPDGTQVGMFIRELPKDLQNLVNIADTESLSERVPKMDMERTGSGVRQYSTILGSIPIKPHLGRNYPSRSSVHQNKKAQTFIKAMYAAGIKAFDVIQSTAPQVAAGHLKAIEKRVPEKWSFSKYFTSTISNANIAAAVHQDHANVKGAVNIIITKRRNSTGGNLHVPEFGATFDQVDGSMLVYPAYRNRHGVTPIVPTHQGGYRNSHVWYALDSFASL